MRSPAWCVLALGPLLVPPAGAANLLNNGSFEGPTGAAPSGWMIGGTATDGYLPVAIRYQQASLYPTGAQNEAVPVDYAASLGPDPAGSNGVYFVSDEARNLSFYQFVHLAAGSYDIGFDSYDTFNGSNQPHDADFTANIAGVQLASFDLASVKPGQWRSFSGKASIATAGDYIVSFTFNTPDTPADPDPTNPGGRYDAKDVVIDRAYVVGDGGGGGTPIPSAVPEPGSWLLVIAGFGMVGAVARARRIAPAPL